MRNYEDYLNILGKQVTDVVTGLSGIATSVSFDLSGCIQIWVSPPVDKKTNKVESGMWIDEKRLTVGKRKTVRADFDVVPGGQDLPDPSIRR